MNKILKGLLVTILAVNAVPVEAHNNKTFLMPRPHGVNLPMEYTTFFELVTRKAENKFGGNLAATFFYQESTNDKKIGDYFLLGCCPCEDNSCCNPCNTCDTCCDTCRTPEATAETKDCCNTCNTCDTCCDTCNPCECCPTGCADPCDCRNLKMTRGVAADYPASHDTLDLGYIIHLWNASASYKANQNVYMGLKPHQQSYGVRFDYWQDLDKILKGLYLKLDLPVVHVENDPKLAFAGTTEEVEWMKSFISGNFTGVSTANAQDKLCKAKICGKHSETGVADIDLALGYKFLNKSKYAAGLALAITIPTGNDADGTWVFEPIVGNGNHFGLGGDLWAFARIWGDLDHNIKLHIKMKYRYLFESSECRTLGFKNCGACCGMPIGQYHLLLRAGVAQGAATSLVPLANVSTLSVDVTPGSQFDGILGFAYNNGGFTFDLGYNLYYREAESVKTKCGCFTDGKYAFAARNVRTDALQAATPETFTPANVAALSVVDGATSADKANAILTRANLDTEAAATPSQFTNSIYGEFGYNFKEWDTPLLLGIGGKYEWPAKNSALEQWSINAKIGIGF